MIQVTVAGGQVIEHDARTFTLETDGQLHVYQTRQDAAETRFIIAAYSHGSWSHVIAAEDADGTPPPRAAIAQLRRWAVPAGYVGGQGQDPVTMIRDDDLRAAMAEPNPEGSK